MKSDNMKCTKCTCLNPNLEFTEVIFDAGYQYKTKYNSSCIKMRCKKCGKLRGFMSSDRGSVFHKNMLSLNKEARI